MYRIPPQNKDEILNKIIIEFKYLNGNVTNQQTV